MRKSTLGRLLDDCARFDLGSRGTADHLPMALVALSRMGATTERLVEYFHWWEENRALPRRDSGRQVDRGDWKQYIGDPRMFDALWIPSDAGVPIEAPPKSSVQSSPKYQAAWPRSPFMA